MDKEKKIRENDVLRRLPARSLFRFTAVCKEWFSKITSTFFPRHQATSFRSISGFFYQSSETGVPSFLSLDPAYGVPDPLLSFLPEPVDVRSSSSGLLCCQGRSQDRLYYICNPVTKKWTQLPKSREDHKADPAVVLVVDQPSISLSLFGVAEYRLVCAYHVVLFAGRKYKSGYKFDVYSSTTRSWESNPLEFLSDAGISLQPKSGFHLKNTVYWHSNDGRVVAFELGRNRYRLCPRVDGILGTINGKVCAARISEQRLLVKVLGKPICNKRTFTEAFYSLNDTWEPNSFDVTLHSEFSSAALTSGGGLVFVGGNVLLLRKGNIFFSSDLMEKTSTCLGEVSIGNEERMVPYINNLVDLVGQVSQ